VSDEYKIYVDANQPATFNNDAGALTDCATCKRRCWPGTDWHLSKKIRATVKVIGGPVYTAKEIERLHYGPKPADAHRCEKLVVDRRVSELCVSARRRRLAGQLPLRDGHRHSPSDECS
jgi:hypothetical protein